MKKYFYAMTVILAVLLAGMFLKPKERATERREHSEAMEALDFWSTQRAYPARSISDAAFYRAYERSRVMTRGTAAIPGSWQTLGPHNVAGRTLAVAFNPMNPNTIYAGSASGGLWRSTSGGVGASAWAYIPTGYPALSVSTIAVAPADSQTIYIGTGEVYGYQNAIGGLSIRTTRGSYGIGILKTTDGGASWTKSLDWSYADARGVWSVRINPLNPNTLYAGTTEGVYKSTDAGASWFEVHSVIMAMDVLIHPTDTNTVLVACGDLASPNNGIYRSTNGGANWTKMTAGLPASFGGKANFGLYRTNPNIIYASIGNGSNTGDGTWLCRSTDAGATWTTVATTDYSTYQGWYSHVVGVNPVDSSKVICAGIDVYKSINGGTTLTQKWYWYNYYGGIPLPGEPEGPPNYSHADHHALAWHPTNPNIVYFGNDGGVFRSTDGGETFMGCNGGYQSTQFYNGFANSALDSNLAVGGLQDNASAIYRGDDAWERDVVGGDGAWCGVDPTAANVLYASVYYLQIYKSTDDGQNWDYISPSIGGASNFVSPFVLCPTVPDIIYAATSYVARTTDGGSFWTTTNNGNELDGNPVLSLAVARDNPDVVYAGTTPISAHAGVFVTTSGGATWQNRTGSLPDRYPVDIVTDPADEATAYVAFSGFGTGHVFRTTDYGVSWTDISSGLPDVPTSAVLVDPLNPAHVYAGDDLGVYVTTNSGATWEPFQEGLPGACIVMDLTVSPANDKIRVATHGNGVYERPFVRTAVGIAGGPPRPTDFTLKQNYPNPFNPTTQIRFTLTGPARVNLMIYNVLGQSVRALVHEADQAGGSYSVTWDGRNDAGQRVPSGIYVYRLSVGSRSAVRKMLFVK